MNHLGNLIKTVSPVVHIDSVSTVPPCANFLQAEKRDIFLKKILRILERKWNTRHRLIRTVRTVHIPTVSLITANKCC